MKRKLYEAIKLFVLLFIFFNIGKLLGFIFSAIGVDVAEFTIVDHAHIEIFVKAIIFLLIFLAYRDVYIDDWAKFREKLGYNLKKTGQLFLIFFAVKFGAGLVVAIFSQLFGIEAIQSENQEVINSYVSAAPLLMFISAVFLAPFYEEGLFRLGFKKVFTNKYTFMIISGLVFGLVHIFPTDINLTTAAIQAIPYVAMGVVLAWIYVETKNFYHVTIVHLLNNLVSVIVILLLLLL